VPPRPYNRTGTHPFFRCHREGRVLGAPTAPDRDDGRRLHARTTDRQFLGPSRFRSSSCPQPVDLSTAVSCTLARPAPISAR
jgi:hypothetical protein